MDIFHPRKSIPKTMEVGTYRPVKPVYRFENTMSYMWCYNNQGAYSSLTFLTIIDP